MNNVEPALMAIDNMYQEEVEKNDKLGYAEKFKEATELFFKELKKDITINIEDVKFLDGYFIFGYGTNSVVHFHIKECPGWKFGIWWDNPKDNDATSIKGEFFAQYEETIDKFKPSASNISATFYVNFEHDSSVYPIHYIISFIQNEPELAFCRDYCYWNYNLEYHTREEAKAKFEEYKKHHEDEIKYTKLCDDRVLNFVKEKVIPNLGVTDAKIVDLGENWSPRYDIDVPLEKNKDIVDEAGCYSWFDETDEDDKKIMEEFHQLIEECGKLCSKYHVCWYSPIHTSMNFYEEKSEENNNDIIKK